MRIWGSEIKAGRMKFLPNSKLAAQLKTITWDKHFMREAENTPCDLHDAGLYAHRACYHWLAEHLAEQLRPVDAGASTAEREALDADDAYIANADSAVDLLY